MRVIGALDKNNYKTDRYHKFINAKTFYDSKEKWQKNRDYIKQTCYQCHSKTFVENHFTLVDKILKEADRITAEAILEIEQLQEEGLLTIEDKGVYSIDILKFYKMSTPIEIKLFDMIFKYRMRTFQGAFHINSDYMHWEGYAELNKSLTEIKRLSAEMRRLGAKKK